LKLINFDSIFIYIHFFEVFYLLKKQFKIEWKKQNIGILLKNSKPRVEQKAKLKNCRK